MLAENRKGSCLGTGALKVHFVSRPFYGRGVGSSILASLSEAGGNDLRQPLSKPLPPRSPISLDRHSKCTRPLRSKRETRLCENPTPSSLSSSASCQRGSSCNMRKSVQFGSRIPLRESLPRGLRKSSRHVCNTINLYRLRSFPTHIWPPSCERFHDSSTA